MLLLKKHQGTNMVIFDKNKCIGCGACVRDCIVEILRMDESMHPQLLPELERHCINCQHCLAVCPAGAVTCNGKTAADCREVEPLPEPELAEIMIHTVREVVTVQHL